MNPQWLHKMAKEKNLEMAFVLLDPHSLDENTGGMCHLSGVSRACNDEANLVVSPHRCLDSECLCFAVVRSGDISSALEMVEQDVNYE